jgi:predicted CoA-binding protein
LEKLKVAVVGTGHLGKEHARIYSEMSDVSLVGVVDTDKDAGEAVAGRCKTRYYSSIKEILNKVDVASVVVPTKSHYEITKELLNNGLTVRGLLDELALIDLQVAQQAELKWSSYRPRIVFNKCKSPDELTLLPALENTLKHNLLLRTDFIGCLFDDPAVSMTFQQRETLNKVSPSAEIAEDIRLLADRIIRLWKQPLRNSAELLINNANKIYHQRSKEHKN